MLFSILISIKKSSSLTLFLGHAGDPELHISTKFAKVNVVDIGKQVKPRLQKTKSLLGTGMNYLIL